VSVPFNTKQFEDKPNPKMPATTVRLDKVVATQRYLDPAKVQSIAKKGAYDGTDPLVAKHNGRYYVLDGHHRVGGALERGDTKIRVRRVK